MTPPSERPADRLAGLTLRDRHRLAGRLERAARRPGGPSPQEVASIERAIAAGEARRAARAATVPAVTYPDELPITARREEILDALRRHQVVVVAGETGSGKTTQLPKMCLELGRGVDGTIGHTQPRRIAARTVAERLADELGVPLGGAVGYAVRFADAVGESTLVKVMTDGILLAEIHRDRLLSAYDTIIVDEAHERSLNVDFLLGYLTRLLPRRPELKVVVTSATIDTARFAAHFAAPVVEVSGRAHRVEVRYRPLRPEASGEGDRDPGQALCDAVRELLAAGPGDVLAFLAGERDIRDAAEALRSGGLEGIEILPLYARLSSAEQHRVFRPHRGRRVVLATNVAETSLTVPGIRFVIDSGLARISRYSHRTKVQRLPIERVSRASADQRAGRCGRVAPGICIRLYSEEDYASRPEFTEPEVLRTNLASVILQMAVIGLGEIEAFPFLEPPDRRTVADGRALLEELGAFERHDGRLRLTALGRRLAELPLDPRLARMVVEAERRDCLREVTVIAAALSIQDPRERPAERAGEADELHARFAVPDSDFLGFVRLFDYLAELQGELSGNQFRKRCRAELLNVLRVREWQDVAGQIRQSYRSRGVHANRQPAAPDEVHRALLAGLLSQVGMRDRVRGDYQGARGTRWRIARSSALARRQPGWAMAGALVETEGTWARTVARVEPAWAEELGAHLVRRSRSEPWWDPERGEALLEERVSLYGLPIVAGRRLALARVDPEAARETFIWRALVERDWQAGPEPLARTAARIARIRELEDRLRRRHLLAGPEGRFAFYDARVPAEVTGGGRFERWWRRAGAAEPDLLDVPLEVLLDPAAGSLELSDYPDTWSDGALELPLRYRFAPGAPDDGVTVEVPLAALNRLDANRCDWHVPGFRLELVAALVRALPKPLRRALLPAADVARQVVDSSGPEDGPLLEVVAARLSRIGGVEIRADLWDLGELPAHLRLAFEVLDGSGRVQGSGRDLGELRHRLAGEVRSAVAAALPGLERHGASAWDFGDLPRRVEQGAVLGYPSLVDEGAAAVGVAVLESPAAQADAMWRGTRRLLLLQAPSQPGALERRLTNDAKLAIARSGLPLRQLLDDCARAVADEILLAHGGPAFEAAGFAEMAAEACRELAGRVARLAALAADVLAAAARVEARASALEAGHQASLAPVLADVRRQLDELVPVGFVTRAGEHRLAELPRYLEAAGRRLERLPADLRRDAERQAAVARVLARHDRLAEALAAGTAPPGAAAALVEARWMIEELRVSLWAQSLGTPTPVSEQRIARALDRMTA